MSYCKQTWLISCKDKRILSNANKSPYDIVFETCFTHSPLQHHCFTQTAAGAPVAQPLSTLLLPCTSQVCPPRQPGQPRRRRPGHHWMAMTLATSSSMGERGISRPTRRGHLDRNDRLRPRVACSWADAHGPNLPGMAPPQYSQRPSPLYRGGRRSAAAPNDRASALPALRHAHRPRRPRAA